MRKYMNDKDNTKIDIAIDRVKIKRVKKPSFWARLLDSFNALFNQSLSWLGLYFIMIVIKFGFVSMGKSQFLGNLNREAFSFYFGGHRLHLSYYTLSAAILLFALYKFSERRQFKWALLVALFPLWVSFIVTYYQRLRFWGLFLLIAPVALTLAISLLFLSINYRTFKRSELALTKRFNWIGIIKSELAQYIGFLYGTIILTILIAYPMVFVKSPGTLLTVGDATPKQIVEGNLNTLVALRNHKLADVPPEQRLELLHTICKIEMAYLGIDNVEFKVARLRDNVRGCYSSTENTVSISDDYYNESIYEVINTISHECYHAYQHRCVDYLRGYQITDDKLIMLRQLKTWQSAFDFGLFYSAGDEEQRDKYIKSAHEYTARKYSYARQKYYKDLAAGFQAGKRSAGKLIEPSRARLNSEIAIPNHYTIERKGDDYHFKYNLLDERTTYGDNLFVGLALYRDLDGSFHGSDSIKYTYFALEIGVDNTAEAVINGLKEGYYSVQLNSKNEAGKFLYVSSLGQLKFENRELISCVNPHILKHNQAYDSNALNTIVEIDDGAVVVKALTQPVIADKTTDFDKALALYDLLAEKAIAVDESESSYSAIINKLSVGNNVRISDIQAAKLYYLMLNAAEIPCRVTTGNRTESHVLQGLQFDESDRVLTNYMWNQVYIKELKRWVNVDIYAAIRSVDNGKEIERNAKSYRHFAIPLEVLSNTHVANGYIYDFDNAKEWSKRNEIYDK